MDQILFRRILNYCLIFEDGTKLENKYILWDGNDNIIQSKLMTIARDEYNIDHGFTIIEKSNTKANNYYINNLSKFHGFIYYFLDKSESLSKLAYITKIKFDEPSILQHKNPSSSLYEVTYPNSELHINYFNLKGNLEGISITLREAECLAYRFNGCTIKEIGSILKISPRTVETHINNTKIKLCCNSLYEINKIRFQTGLNDIFNYLLTK